MRLADNRIAADPAELGRGHRLVLGKHSGRHALRERIKELGFELGDAEFARVFEEFKALAQPTPGCPVEAIDLYDQVWTNFKK